MNTLNDLITKLNTDEAYTKEFAEVVRKRMEEDGIEFEQATLAAAKDFGYEVKTEELHELIEQRSESLSEEDLEKIAGGEVLCIIGLVICTATLGFTINCAADPLDK